VTFVTQDNTATTGDNDYGSNSLAGQTILRARRGRSR
jgi:hypothetical protein